MSKNFSTIQFDLHFVFSLIKVATVILLFVEIKFQGKCVRKFKCYIMTR